MAFSNFNKPIELKRPTPGDYVLGEWTEWPMLEYVIETSVQPADRRKMMSLFEGRRYTDAYSLYTTFEVRVKDLVKITGDWYEVLAVNVWQNGILPHYHAVAEKMAKESEN